MAAKTRQASIMFAGAEGTASTTRREGVGCGAAAAWFPTKVFRGLGCSGKGNKQGPQTGGGAVARKTNLSPHMGGGGAAERKPIRVLRPGSGDRARREGACAAERAEGWMCNSARAEREPDCAAAHARVEKASARQRMCTLRRWVCCSAGAKGSTEDVVAGWFCGDATMWQGCISLPHFSSGLAGRADEGGLLFVASSWNEGTVFPVPTGGQCSSIHSRHTALS